jgi:hypothetical protein
LTVTDHNIDREQLARLAEMGQEWEDDATPAAHPLLVAALAIGAACIALAFLAFFWGRV